MEKSLSGIVTFPLRSALGLMARFFVRLKTHMHDCRRLQAAAWESDAEGRRDDHQAHRDHAW